MYWCDGACLGEFSVVLVREYISYLQTASKYAGHPFHESVASRDRSDQSRAFVVSYNSNSKPLQCQVFFVEFEFAEAISNFRGKGLYPVAQAIETANMLPALVQLR